MDGTPGRGSSGSRRSPLQRAIELAGAGRLAEAKALLLGLVARQPHDFELAGLLAECHAHLGELAPAEHHARRATKLRPGDPSPWVFLAKLALAKGDKEGVEHAARSALAAAPGDLESRRLLTWVLLETDRFVEARALAREGRALAPADADFWLKEGNALRALGRAREALALHEEGLRACPASADLAVARAYSTNFVLGMPPEAVREAHEVAGRLIADAMALPGFVSSRPPRRNDLGADRIRVGLVSPDLRRHAVASFLRPIFEHHDRARIDLRVYSTTTAPDEISAALRQQVQPGGWRDLPGADPRALAMAMADDVLDLAIDAAGHTKQSHLAAFALRPAPVQATYVGYPATTGLAAIDARIVDSITDPIGSPPEADRACSERLWRLEPCFLCYAPPEDAPPVMPRPDRRPVTFGSFNMLPKLNDDVFALWARVMSAVPEARLLIKCRGLSDPLVRAEVGSRLVSAGISPERVDLTGFIPEPGGHLAAYSRIDIALDTSPYCGTTTTCEALHMGVPVVTLAAQPPWHPRLHASRVGASLLSAAGLAELIAPTDATYVETCAHLAASAPRLAEYRSALRDQLRHSTLCDAKSFGAKWSDLVCILAKSKEA